VGAGLVRSWASGKRYDIDDLRFAWLVPIAFLPQFCAFQLPATRSQIPVTLVAAALVSSQATLLVFTWANRFRPGFGFLSFGLALNLAVILLNGGLMPISPETIARLIPELPGETWPVGMRFGTGKDIILATESTRLWWLADRLLLPAWFPYRAAFSIGDVMIAVGAFWFFWSSGRQRENIIEARRLI
jgi:hypothetical protein